MKSLTKFLIVPFVLAVAEMPSAPYASAQAAPAQAAVSEETKTFAIENMTCPLCPVTVRTAIEGVAGVKSVTVDFEAKTAMVVFDSSVATVEAIAAASTNAGYPASLRN